MKPILYWNQKWLFFRMKRKFFIDQEEARRALHAMLDLSSRDIDTKLLERCLVKLYPEIDDPIYKAPGQQRVLENVKKYISLNEMMHTPNNDVEREMQSRSNRVKRYRPALISAILLSILVLGTSIAYALGFPIWNYVFHWGDEQVHIDIEIQAPVNSPEASTENRYFGLGKGDAFDEKLKELQMNPVLPKLPDECMLTFVDNSGGDTLKNIVGLYNAGSSTIHISVTKVNDVNAALDETIEKDGNAYDMIEIDGTSYYLFSNLDTSEVIWVSPPYIIQLGGDISKDKLLSMIETMDGGISND